MLHLENSAWKLALYVFIYGWMEQWIDEREEGRMGLFEWPFCPNAWNSAWHIVGAMWNCSLLSHVWLFATPWTVAWQAPLSMEFSKQEYWSGLLFSSPRDFPNPGIKPRLPAFQADSLPFEPPGKSYVLHSIGYYSAFACQGSQSPWSLLFFGIYLETPSSWIINWTTIAPM